MTAIVWRPADMVSSLAKKRGPSVDFCGYWHILQPEWPADKVERRAVAALIPYARNARTHSPEQVDQIAASIREWGWTVVSQFEI